MEELNGVKTEDKDKQAPKLRAGRFLNRLDSAILFGIVGTITAGLAVHFGFVPTTIGGYSTSLGTGVGMFVAEWIRGIVE